VDSAADKRKLVLMRSRNSRDQWPRAGKASIQTDRLAEFTNACQPSLVTHILRSSKSLLFPPRPHANRRNAGRSFPRVHRSTSIRFARHRFLTSQFFEPPKKSWRSRNVPSITTLYNDTPFVFDSDSQGSVGFTVHGASRRPMAKHALRNPSPCDSMCHSRAPRHAETY